MTGEEAGLTEGRRGDETKPVNREIFQQSQTFPSLWHTDMTSGPKALWDM
jgi:hypothetical protein